MNDKPDFPADVPATPPVPGKTQPIPPEMPPSQVPTPEDHADADAPSRRARRNRGLRVGMPS